ncbi:MAG: dTMP kinase [Bacteroidetes bacterium]|nr:dTMP kinase [Bacteroidota bacterium]MCY4232467.1 dTMP kinase [Bacteroidota bacterium]
MLLAIEGIDGSGKGTQAKELVDRLRGFGQSAELLSFPRYSVTNASQLIADYLTGKFGEISDIPAEFASILFAMDRMESRDHLHTLLSQNDVVIVDRYVPSNLAYQTSRISNPKRDQFLSWLIQLEYDIYDLPRPDLTIFLDVPAVISQQLVALKETRVYTEEVYDIHERNTEFLSKVRNTYHWLIESQVINPCHIIECTNSDGNIKEMSDIAQDVFDLVIQRLNEH